jgi:hypothetical protein
MKAVEQSSFAFVIHDCVVCGWKKLEEGGGEEREYIHSL